MSTGSELEEVQGVDGRGLDTWDVAESANKLLSVLVGVVDDERTTALPVATVPELTLTGADLLGGLDLLNVLTGTNSLQERKSSRGLGNGGVGESGGGNDKRNLRDSGDLVTAGKKESSAGRCSDGGSSCETPGEWVSFLCPSKRGDAAMLTSGQR